MLSARKADKEGHPADAVGDTFFRIVLALRFRLRGESQLDSVCLLFEVQTKCRVEGGTSIFIVIADRGYGKPSSMELLTKFEFSSVFVMPGHLLRVRSFVASWYLNPSRGHTEEGLAMGEAIKNVIAADASETGMVALLSKFRWTEGEVLSSTTTHSLDMKPFS